MKAHFKYPRSFEGKHYAPGHHEMPDALAEHWYVKALVKSGDVTFSDEPKAEKAKAEAQEDAEPTPQPQKSGKRR